MSTAARDRRQPDRLLLFTTFLLCGGGLVMVTSASVAFAYTQHQSAFYYAERQGAWMFIGFVALFVLSRIDYHRLRPLAPAGAVVAGLLMILVLVPHLGVTVNGARRWFDAGPLGTFQPSELGKLAFAVFIAHWVDKNSAQMGSFQKAFVPFVAMLAGVLVLLMLERDLGTSIVVVGIFVSTYWAGGGRMRHMVLLVAGLGLAFVALSVFESYRLARLTAYVNPWADPLGAGFQATQSLYGFLFFGLRGYRAALRAPDRFGVGLAASITTWICFEALLNMATVTNTLPITGVPLPFFSYGGTAVATTLAAVGVLLSIARSGTGSSLGRTDEVIDRWRRDRRAPLSGARSRASS